MRQIEMETNAHPCADQFGSHYLGSDTLIRQSQSDAVMDMTGPRPWGTNGPHTPVALPISNPHFLSFSIE